MSKTPTNLQLCPLHTHTTFSVLDGASTIDEYIKWSVENGAPALGVTDHGYAIGLMELYKKAKKAGITPIPGVEVYVLPDEDYKFTGKPFSYFHLTLWAYNEVGYRNLIKLASMSWAVDEVDGWKKDRASGLYKKITEPRVSKKWGTQLKPRLKLSEIAELSEGIIAGSGCLIGMVNKSLLNGDHDMAERNLQKLKDIFPNRLFVEVMGHVCDHDFDRETKSFKSNPCSDFSPNGDLQTACNFKNIELADKYKLPLLLTEDSHFVKPEQKAAQDILLQNGDPQGWRFHNSYHMRTSEQVWDEYWLKTFGNDSFSKKLFCEAVENNHVIAQMAKDITITDRFHQPEPKFSEAVEIMDAPIKDKLKLQLLEEIERYGRMKWDNPQYVERLNTELAVICDNGEEDFAPYFLFFSRWAQWARDHSILSGAGRGSGGGCLLFYLLKVTHINPLNPSLNLPFSRFLSPGRIKRKKWPDYDWDTGARDLLVAAMHECYGDKMAQCSTMQTLKTRSAIKDVSRVVLGWNSQDPRLDEITKSMSLEPQGVTSTDYLNGYTTPEGEYVEGELFNNQKLYDFFKLYPEVKTMTMSLLGIPKAIGRHASAFLISDAPISDSSPTCDLSGSGFLVTQYNANAAFNAVETAGLVKVDLLRINTLEFISGGIRLIQKKMGYKVWEETIKVDGQDFVIVRGELPIETLPMPDGSLVDIYELPEIEGVFTDITDGKTAACFQISSPAMTSFCKRVKPTLLEHMSAIVALDRPGPLDAPSGDYYDGKSVSMADSYILRKAGKIPVSYMHPDAEPILRDTYGIPVYQEQTQALLSLAGYSEEESDYMRELLSKKKKQEVDKFIPDLRNRLVEKGWSNTQVETMLGLIDACAAYQFNRAHSAAYGLLAYQCAFLKHFYPLEYWTAVLSNSKVDDIREKGYAREIQDILELPHVNGPTDQFRLGDGKVHAPIYLIAGVKNAASGAISQCQIAGGHFTSFQDFYDRIDKTSVDQKVVFNLILCGAFRLIEPGISIKDLFRKYCYFRRVQSLKIGRGKSGEALAKAVEDFQKLESLKASSLDLPPEAYMDGVQLELARMSAIPIWRVDVHEEFRRLLQTFIIYGSDGMATFRFPDGTTLRVYKNNRELLEDFKNGKKEAEGVFVGLLSSQEEFQYMKNKGKPDSHKVTALKLQVANDGDSVEAILWPNIYEKSGKAKEDRILLCRGRIQPSRESGKFTMSISEILDL